MQRVSQRGSVAFNQDGRTNRNPPSWFTGAGGLTKGLERRSDQITEIDGVTEAFGWRCQQFRYSKGFLGCPLKAFGAQTNLGGIFTVTLVPNWPQHLLLHHFREADYRVQWCAKLMADAGFEAHQLLGVTWRTAVRIGPSDC